MTVANGVGEGVGTGVVRARKVGDGPVLIDDHCPVGGHRHGGHRQRVAVEVRVIGEHPDRCRRIFNRRRDVVCRHGRVVDRQDHDGHGRGVRVETGVVRLVREAVAPVEIGGGRVAEAAIDVEEQRAVSWLGDHDRREAAVLDVGVVGQETGRGDGQHAVFVRAVGVVGGDGAVVDRGDRDRHRRRRRVGRPVTGLVDEAVGAVEVGGRRIDEAAIGVEPQRAVRGAGDERGRQRATLDVGVVAQHTGRIDGERLILEGAVCIRERDRFVVHRVDRDGDRRGGRGVGGAVVRPINEAVAAVEVGRWRVGEAAVGIEHQRAVSRPRHEHCPQRIGVDIGVVGEHTGRDDGQGGIFVGAVAVAARDWRVVAGRHHHREFRPPLVEQVHPSVPASRPHAAPGLPRPVPAAPCG